MRSNIFPARAAWAALLLCSACANSAETENFAEIQSKIVSFKLENGLTVILYRRGDMPVISCVTYVKAGSADEFVGITGIAHQLEHLAFKGTPNIGTTNYEAEKAVFKDMDQIYTQIQAFEQKLPAESRDRFLSLLAQLTSTGGAQAEQSIAPLIESWKKSGLTLSAEEQAALTGQVKQYASKVAEADKHVAANQYSAVIELNGGVGLNAFTSADRTVYHVSLPSNKLELWAALESDRHMNTVPRQLEKEKQVVLEERRMRTESNSWGRLYETFLGVAFQAHPYGVSVIGHRSDILGYTREKVMRFYREHYVPAKTVVAVVGDVDVDAARKIITDYFGRIPKAAESARKDASQTVEPPQAGERRFEVEFPSQPMLLIGFHIPERSHPDTPALVMLDRLASSGKTSRLHAHLVNTGKASAASSWIGPGERFPRLFMFSAEPSAAKDGSAPADAVAALEANLLAEIEKLKTEPPTAEELAGSVTRYRADVLRGLRSNLGLAQELADYQALSGDWRNLFREIKQISSVTPGQVAAAASKYFTRKNRTLGRIVPAIGDTPAAPPAPETIMGVPVK
jgi:predicted Zn-dependent peptidase